MLRKCYNIINNKSKDKYNKYMSFENFSFDNEGETEAKIISLEESDSTYAGGLDKYKEKENKNLFTRAYELFNYNIFEAITIGKGTGEASFVEEELPPEKIEEIENNFDKNRSELDEMIVGINGEDLLNQVVEFIENGNYSPKELDNYKRFLTYVNDKRVSNGFDSIIMSDVLETGEINLAINDIRQATEEILDLKETKEGRDVDGQGEQWIDSKEEGVMFKRLQDIKYYLRELEGKDIELPEDIQQDLVDLRNSGIQI